MTWPRRKLLLASAGYAQSLQAKLRAVYWTRGQYIRPHSIWWPPRRRSVKTYSVNYHYKLPTTQRNAVLQNISYFVIPSCCTDVCRCLATSWSVCTRISNNKRKNIKRREITWRFIFNCDSTEWTTVTSAAVVILQNLYFVGDQVLYDCNLSFCVTHNRWDRTFTTLKVL